MIRAKLEQAAGLLAELDIDLWMIFTRESATVHDPSIDLVVGGNVTWASAFLIGRQGERIAIEVETGKSNIKANLTKVRDAGFDRLVFVGTSPAAVGACHRAIEAEGMEKDPSVNLMSWLDVG